MCNFRGITQNPTKFNPILNPDSNKKRRKEVLQHMLDQNYITEEQYKEALEDDVYSRIQAAQENTPAIPIPFIPISRMN